MFDFLRDEPKEPLIPEVVHHGPNSKSLKKMTRKQVIQDFLDVYGESGMGKNLIRQHMLADPKSFFDVLKKFIPNQMSLDTDEMVQINLIDRYGNRMELSARPEVDTEENEDSHPTANRDLTSPRGQNSHQIVLTERFEGSPSNKIANASNLAFDFTV